MKTQKEPLPALEELDVLRSISLLLVDDEPQILEFLKWALKSIASDIAVAPSGEEALALCERQKVDVAIVDLCLPGMDGITLVTELRKKNPRMLVVVLTGQGEEGTLRAAVKAGAYDFLDKPVDADQIRLAVARYVDKVKTDEYLNLLLRELFIAATGCMPVDFDNLDEAERSRHLQALLGFLRLKFMRKEGAA